MESPAPTSPTCCWRRPQPWRIGLPRARESKKSDSNKRPLASFSSPPLHFRHPTAIPVENGPPFPVPNRALSGPPIVLGQTGPGWTKNRVLLWEVLGTRLLPGLVGNVQGE